ncbi:MAG TPA: response regulator [Proteobacteria bacterium]|nr:response regulator [Pseudomonadota bacterium]
MKVIIVEDEEAHLELMERAIRRDSPDVQIYPFVEIESCLNSIDRIDPDVIITDYMLPGMDGLEFLEELRKKHRGIPVVVTTGQGDENIAVRAMKLGAGDYVVKSGDFFSLLPSIIKNVVHQEELKKALRESQALYEREKNKLNSILASLVTPLAVINGDTRIDFANPIFERIFGKELIGKPCQAIFDQSSDACFQCLKAVENRQTGSVEFEDVNERIWQVTISPGIEKEGDILKAVLIFQDITERKAYEKQLQHLSEKMIRVQEEERGRISRELHDELGQVVAALKFDAAWLKGHLSDENIEVKERLQEMCALIDGSLDAVRRISSGLRPGILDDMGLGAAVEWYALEFGRRSGLECVTLIDLPERRLAGHLETGIYRIVQEALTNVARHAKASMVTISMKHNKETLFVQVVDNGMGIEPSKIRSPLSTGLAGMRERCEILSGTMEIKGDPGKGTQVKVQVPVMYR